MDPPTFSRSYLQGLPEIEKQHALRVYIQRNYTGMAKKAAVEGKSYIVFSDTTKMMMDLGTPHRTYSLNDLISGFQACFPDCTVSYEEEWVQTNANTRTLQKGIRVDWS